MSKYVCSYCGKEFELSKKQEVKLKKEPNKKLFCSSQCSGKYGASLRKPVANSLRSSVIKFTCSYCGKEFELSYNQKRNYKSGKSTKFYCCTSCKNKGKAISKTMERPNVKCAYCGKEFELSRDQLTKYNRDKNAKLFCSKSCIMKYTNKNYIDFEIRSKKMSELSKDAQWVENRTNKTKQTNLEKYGVENVFQTQFVKDKSKQTKLEKYGDENYNNREKMFETMKEHNFDIYAPRPNVGKKISNTWKNKSDEEKQKIKDKLSISNKKAHDNMTLYDKLELSAKLSIAQKHRWENTTDLEKQELFKKVFSHPNTAINVISKLNKDIATTLNITEFEYQLGKYSYDLKKDNILIEVDPTYTHNCLNGTWYGSAPKTKEYHRDKTLYAMDNGFECIHIFDWDDIDKIKNIFLSKYTLYARQTNIKSVSEEECNNFLNKYHLQNNCKGQIIRFGLYKGDELIEIMTFGKPRYNKNYEWELLRLCTKPEYKVVGGAEKLFKHFIDVISPQNIISYCDFSKFSGEVYNRLGFKQKGSIVPSKHWSKGSQHITDNLLRQRGYDQLFNANYGKGTCNEELMIIHGWLPIYDCGQITFVWNK